MRKLAIAAVMACLGWMGIAGPFVGVEIVPTGNNSGPAGLANFAVGWDSGTWIKTTFLFRNPFYFEGGYGISLSPLWGVTPSWRIGGVARFGFEIQRFRFISAGWAVGFETAVKWEGVLAWIQVTFPMDIHSDLPLGGAWLTIGVAFDFSPGGAGLRSEPSDYLGQALVTAE